MRLRDSRCLSRQSFNSHFAAAPVSMGLFINFGTYGNLANMTINPLEMTFVDDPAVQEVYVNSPRFVGFLDGDMHLDLCTTRLECPAPGQPPTRGQALLKLRIVMPASCAAAIHASLGITLAELQKQQSLSPGSAPVIPPTPTPPAKH